MSTQLPKNREITVCDKCLRASCWHGIWMCDDAIGAGLIQLPRWKLDELNREHPSHYSAEQIHKILGTVYV